MAEKRGPLPDLWLTDCVLSLDELRAIYRHMPGAPTDDTGDEEAAFGKVRMAIEAGRDAGEPEFRGLTVGALIMGPDETAYEGRNTPSEVIRISVADPADRELLVSVLELWLDEHGGYQPERSRRARDLLGELYIESDEEGL